MHQEDISSLVVIHWNSLVCPSLYTDFVFDVHKKFLAISTDDKNVECQICNLFYSLNLSYADKSADKKTHENTAKNDIFRFRIS